MLQLSEPVAGVTRIHMWSRVGRAVGLTVSAYLTHGVLVDTGYPGARNELRTFLEHHRVRGAIITHAHEDHGGNAALLADRGVPVGGGATTLAGLRERAELHFHRRLVWGTPEPLPRSAPTFTDDRMRLIPAPGHTPDHHVVWDSERGHLFGGDLFLGVKVRVAHLDEDPRELVRTLRSLAALEPAALLDAHRGMVPHPAPLLRAKADWMEELIAGVDALVASGMDDATIRQRLIGREGLMGWGTLGEYSATNLIRIARQSRRAAVGEVATHHPAEPGSDAAADEAAGDPGGADPRTRRDRGHRGGTDRG